MDLPTGLQLLLGMIVLVSSTGSAVAFYRASMAKETILGLRGDRDDLSERVDRLQEEKEEQAQQIQAQQIQIDGLISENQRLQNYMSGTDAITAFAATAKSMDTERREEHHEMSCLITALQTVQETNHREMMMLLREVVDSR